LEQRYLQDANTLIKTDVTLLFIQTRGLAGRLFRRLAFNDGSWDIVYRDFIEHFYQLYVVFKHNVKFVPGEIWDEATEKKYDEFFKQVLSGKKFMPREALNLFEEFSNFVIKSGIYNLTMAGYKDI